MKFILTRELGRLTRWLRLCGFDAVYFNSDDMNRLFVTAFNESRTIVTKRTGLSAVRSVSVIYIKSDSLKNQLSDLKKKLRGKLGIKRLFTRCADCNKPVYRVHKKSVIGLVPEYVFQTQKNFFQCPGCGKIYWKATHWARAKEFINEVCS